MRRNPGNICAAAALLSVLLLAPSCVTSSGVGSNVITGRGWNHPDKMKQEQQADYLECRDGCETSVRAKGHTGDSAVFHLKDCEDECMQGKGYEWH